jgi:hypothetical protein
VGKQNNLAQAAVRETTFLAAVSSALYELPMTFGAYDDGGHKALLESDVVNMEILPASAVARKLRVWEIRATHAAREGGQYCEERLWPREEFGGREFKEVGDGEALRGLNLREETILKPCKSCNLVPLLVTFGGWT